MSLGYWQMLVYCQKMVLYIDIHVIILLGGWYIFMVIPINNKMEKKIKLHFIKKRHWRKIWDSYSLATVPPSITCLECIISSDLLLTFHISIQYISFMVITVNILIRLYTSHDGMYGLCPSICQVWYWDKFMNNWVAFCYLIGWLFPSLSWKFDHCIKYLFLWRKIIEIALKKI